MYLLSQLWWLLLLAFLLGLLLGYILWRACGQRRIEASFERNRTDLATRLASVEQERRKFSDTAVEAEREATSLRTEIARLRSALAEAQSAANELAELKRRHADDAARSRRDAEANAEAAKKHSEELKRARDEAVSARAADMKRAQDEAAAEAGRNAAELKKVREELAKAHAAELKKEREDIAADAARKHAEEIRKLREDAAREIAKREADARNRSGERPMALENEGEPAQTQKSARGARADEKAPAQGGKTDDLKLIWGVGPEIEKLLHKNGITRFAQIADWEVNDLSWLESVLPDFKGRSDGEKWVEQARKLAKGWRPERGIGDRPDDLELLKAPRGGRADDLKLIWGIGPKLEKMLNNAGFYHFDQIARWTDTQLAWVDSQLGEFAGRAQRDDWIGQSKKLAAGWRPSKESGDKPR